MTPEWGFSDCCIDGMKLSREVVGFPRLFFAHLEVPRHLRKHDLLASAGLWDHFLPEVVSDRLSEEVECRKTTFLSLSLWLSWVCCFHSRCWQPSWYDRTIPASRSSCLTRAVSIPSLRGGAFNP